MQRYTGPSKHLDIGLTQHVVRFVFAFQLRKVLFAVYWILCDTHSLISLQFSNFSRWLRFASQYISGSTCNILLTLFVQSYKAKEGKKNSHRLPRQSPSQPFFGCHATEALRNIQKTAARETIATQAGSSFSFAKRLIVEAFKGQFCGRPVYFVKERRCVKLVLNMISLQTLSTCEIKRIIRGIVANYKYQDHRLNEVGMLNVTN